MPAGELSGARGHMHRRPLLLLSRLRLRLGCRCSASAAAAPSKHSRLRQNRQDLLDRRVTAVELAQAQLQQLQGQQEHIKSFLSLADSQQVRLSVRLRMMPLYFAAGLSRAAAPPAGAGAGRGAGQAAQQRRRTAGASCRLIHWREGEHRQTPACWHAWAELRRADCKLLQDSLCTHDMPTTAGSGVLREYRPPYDATSVQHLRAAGMMLAGKCNLDAFAMGSTTELSDYWVRALGRSQQESVARLAPLTTGSCCSPPATHGAQSMSQADHLAALLQLWLQGSAWQPWAVTQVCWP